MKSKIINLKNLLLNKITLSTILFQWLLIGLALYQRGYWEFSGHFVSDRFLYQLLVLLNFPAVMTVLTLLPPSKEVDTLGEASFFILAITMQWWIIGFFINQIFFYKKSEKGIEN